MSPVSQEIQQEREINRLTLENKQLNAHCADLSRQHHDSLDEIEKLRKALTACQIERDALSEIRPGSRREGDGAEVGCSLPILATYSPCCGMLRQGHQRPAVMHTGLCVDHHGGSLGPTVYLVTDKSQTATTTLTHEQRAAMDRAYWASVESADPQLAPTTNKL